MTTLTETEFKELFDAVLEMAISRAEQRLNHPLSRNIQVELHGAGHPGHLMSPTDALIALYLGPNTFYRVIDIAAVGVTSQYTRVFVRASGHEPGPFEQTWNDPPGTGPFKLIEAMQFEQLPD